MSEENATGIAQAARTLIGDPVKHTTRSSAVDASGAAVAGATGAAVAWSVYGAVNRIAVLEHGRDLDGWRTVVQALREAGATHQSSHAESLAILDRIGMTP